MFYHLIVIKILIIKFFLNKTNGQTLTGIVQNYIYFRTEGVPIREDLQSGKHCVRCTLPGLTKIVFKIRSTAFRKVRRVQIRRQWYSIQKS